MARREYHYWLVAFDEGKPFCIYACPAREGEEKARQRGMELLPGIDFEIKRLPTRDKDTASAYVRGKRLDDGEGLHRSSQRIGRDKSLKRLKRRRLATENNW